MSDDELDELLRKISNSGLKSPVYGEADLQRLPSEKGAYLLVVSVREPIALKPGRLPTHKLEAGWYVYSGSAYGSGGIRSRVARHFRTVTPHHWHIDYLTREKELYAMAFPGNGECALIAELKSSPSFKVAIKNFGSTDCRVCESHLLEWVSTVDN